MNKKQLENLTKVVRNTLPAYNNDRRVIVTHQYTKLGDSIMKASTIDHGYFLQDVYTTFSDSKRRAWEDVMEMFFNDDNSEGFHITSYNTYGFSVSWVNDIGVVYITPNTEYLVVTVD